VDHNERWFDGAPEATVAEALSLLQAVQVPAGTVLMEQDDPDPALLYLMSGTVGVWRDGVPLAKAGPGDVVGEMSLFTGKPRAATVRALDEVHGVVLDRPGYDALRDANNALAWRIERLTLEVLSRRLRAMNAGIAASVAGTPSPQLKPAPGLFDRVRDFLFGAALPPPPSSRDDFDAEAYLRSSPLFADERSSFRVGVARHLRHEAHPAGAMLCTQGEPGDRMFLLATGAVDVLVDVDATRIHRAATLSPGSAFGMSALFEAQPRMASCVATTPIDALVLDRATWESVIAESDRVASALRVAMIRAFSAQLTAAGADYVRAYLHPR
jgi:CRP-like cAMP-binding protein